MRAIAPLLLALSVALPLHAEEAEPRLPAAELVAPALLAGPGYRVEPQAQVRGYQARFRIHTDWGELEAESVEMLAIRIAEIPAVQALYEESVTETLGASLADAAMAPVRAVIGIASSPVRTVTGLPMGVVRYFGEKVSKLGDRARRLGRRIDEGVSHEGSPYREVEGPMGATRDPDNGQARPWWDKPTRELVRFIKGEARYGRARRELAARLGIDPYTSNPLIRPRLDALAWAESAGRLGTGQALALLTGGASEIVGYTQDIHRLVVELAPEDVRARNRERLEPVCTDDDLLEQFLRKNAYSPTLQTEFVERLVAIAPRRGCEGLLETALMAGNEVEARFMVNALRLLDHYLVDEDRGGEFRPYGALPVYHTPRRELVLPLPVDHLSWTDQIATAFDRPGVAGHRHRTLISGGGFSLQSQRMLTERGWSLVPHLPYPGAPPYSVSPAAPAGMAPR